RGCAPRPFSRWNAQEDIAQSPEIPKGRPADRLGVFALATAGGKALTDRPFAVDPPEQCRRRRIERIGRTRLAPDDDAALGHRLVRFDLRATRNRNVVHEGVRAEIDLVAVLRPARMTDAKGVLPERAVVQLHELPDRLLRHRAHFFVK